VKHALSELQPLISTIAELYHMGEKVTITIKRRVIFTRNRELFSLAEKRRQRARAHGMSQEVDKHRQVLKRGRRSCACLVMNHVVTSSDWVGSTLG